MTRSLHQTRGLLRPVSIAPMMDRTDRHYRWIMRRITRRALLYTEMVVSDAVLRGDRERLLGYDASEHPVALQLGGDDPGKLAQCARIAEDLGYDEVNLNVGCPSSRVQAGRFGVCLMLAPHRVAACVEAMRAACTLPVTVKHRIGVDEVDDYAHMLAFVDIVAEAGADRFTVHARKAWLKGLSPKENRNVPPLRYADVVRLKRERPHLHVEINGGVRSSDEIAAHLVEVDAVMIGRAAYDTPMMFAEVDRRFFSGVAGNPSPEHVVDEVAPYLDRWVADGGKPTRVTRHLLNLFAGVPGAKAWRRTLTEGVQTGPGDSSVLRAGLDAVARARDAMAA